MRSHLSECLLVVLVLVLVPGLASADDPESADTVRAREDFVMGTDFAHKAQWSEALAAFERSAKVRPHAVTTYNVGASERALGQYTRARKTLLAALEENAASGGTQLADGLIAETKGYIDQIEHLLATVTVTIAPAGAAIAVDGRPLEPDAASGTFVAGTRAPGAGEAAPLAAFKLVVDPGVHVLTLSRKGYTDALVNRTFAPASTTPLDIALDKLPATFRVESNEPSAVVKFSGADVGFAPVEVSRPAGVYRLEVKKPGFVAYETVVTGQPGEEVNLRAKLLASTPSVLTRWWFWSIAAVVIGGAATATYFIVKNQEEPQRPPLNGGGLGWTVQIP